MSDLYIYFVEADNSKRRIGQTTDWITEERALLRQYPNRSIARAYTVLISETERYENVEARLKDGYDIDTWIDGNWTTVRNHVANAIRNNNPRIQRASLI